MEPSGVEFESKKQVYEDLDLPVAAVLEGVEDPIAAMASFASLVHASLPYASWTGFYRRVDDDLLRVGPYQGTLGCIEIPFSNGVCGAAASRRKTVIVDDVHAYAGHIACDAATRSEIVVPVFDTEGELRAVLDVDSHEPAAFDNEDREGLESLLRHLRPAW